MMNLDHDKATLHSGCREIVLRAEDRINMALSPNGSFWHLKNIQYIYFKLQ